MKLNLQPLDPSMKAHLWLLLIFGILAFPPTATAQWSAQTSGTPQNLASVYFTSSTNGWAVGASGVIRTTTDGGATWSGQTSGTPQNLAGVYFTSSTNGCVVGASGVIRTTTDGGVSWSTRTSSTSNNLVGVYFISATTGWAVGGNGVIIKTTDGGATWSAQSSSTSQNLAGVYFTSTGQGYAVGNSGTILTSSIALPIQLLSFTARSTENQQVALAWKTALEQNAADFDLERSADAVHFEKIGVVKAVGSAASYTFLDKKPLKSFNYYRLKSNDTDTRFEYSSIVSVQVNGKSKVKIYPTLVHENLIVEGAVRFDIVNNLGQVVLQNTNGDNTVSLQQLQNGIYFVRATDENGESFIQKIVKE